MAKRQYFVSGEEYRTVQKRMEEIMRRLSGKGTSLNPQFALDQLQVLVEAGENSPQPSRKKPTLMHKLVKDLFSPQNVKIENVRRWNEQRNWGFTEDDFQNLPAPPEFPENQFGTVVLVPYLENPYKTYMELVAIIKHEHWLCDISACGLLWEQLVVCGAPHEPGLRWEVIDMGGGIDEWPQKKPGWEGFPLRLPPKELMPHAGILAEIAHSPYWARSLYSFVGVPGIWLPGYMKIRKDIWEGHVESGEYLNPTFGTHVCFESWTDDFGRSYDHHRRGVCSKTGGISEGMLSKFAFPVIMK